MVGVEKENFDVSVYRCPKSGVVVHEEWKNKHGLWHRWNDQPLISRNQNPDVIKEYCNVTIYRCPLNGIVVHEEWANRDGVLHRLGDAAVILRDRSTGFDTHHAFWLNGLRHKHDGEPALLEYNEQSGKLFRRSWFVHGELSRPDDLPHVEWLNENTGKVARSEYRISNNTAQGSALHRENGPALLTFDPETGETISADFYRFGRKQKMSADIEPSI